MFNFRLLLILSVLVGLACLTGGCADQFNQAGLHAAGPDELRAAVDAAEAEGVPWRAPFKGVDATLRPDQNAYGGHNIVLNAVYRLDDNGAAKFALFLPQGGKLGQCSRKGREVRCASQPFPGGPRLVRGAFTALDEIFALSPGRSDWTGRAELRQGDSRAGLNGQDQIFLRRRLTAPTGPDGDVYILTNPAGKLLAAYRLGRSTDAQGRLDRPLAWRAVFDERQNYRFTPRSGGWIMDVTITRRIEQVQHEKP